jgi:hypothetical protein
MLRSGGAVRLAARGSLQSDDPEADAYALSVLRAVLDSCKSATPAGGLRTTPVMDHIQLRSAAVAGLPPGRLADQGYAIDASARGVVITGATAAARLYGVQTVRQLALLADGVLPCGRIVDGPALELRGYSLDLSRGRMPDRDEFLRILDVCAAFKLNTLLIYIEDTYPFTRVPAEARRSYGLAPDVLRELTLAARRRSIELIPIVETLGHQERMLSHPSMRRFAERSAARSPWQQVVLDARDWLERRLRPFGLASPDAAPASAMFATTDPETRTLLDSMLDDVLASSGARSIHIGCDEPAELGRGASAEAVRSRGESSVFAEHVRHLAEHARARWGATTWMFDDYVLSHPDVIARLPADLVFVDWHYEPDAAYGGLDSLASAGARRVVTSAGLWNWYSLYPDYSRSFPNILRTTRAAAAHGSMGSILASWGDGGAEDLFGNDLVGLAWFAGCAWDASDADSGRFLERYCRLRFGAAGEALVPAYRALADLELPNGGYNQRIVDRPVLVRRRTPAWIAAMRGLQGRLAAARPVLATAHPTDVYAAAELEALGCTADRFLAAADRELTLDSVATELLAGAGDGSRRSGPRVSASLDRLRDTEARAQRAYVAAWLAHNEESELSHIRARFDTRLAALDSLRACAAENRLSVPARYR